MSHWIRRQRKMAAVVRMHNDQRVINKRVRAVGRMTYFATMHPYVTSSDRSKPMFCHFMELASALPDGAISPELSFVMTRPEGRTGVGPNRFSKKLSEDGPTRSYMMRERHTKRQNAHLCRMEAIADVAQRVAEYELDLEIAAEERAQQTAEEVEQYINDMRYEYERMADDDYLYYPYEHLDNNDWMAEEDYSEMVYGHDWWTYEPVLHAPGEITRGCGCRECVPEMSELPLWVAVLAAELYYPTLMTDEIVQENPRDGFHVDGTKCFDITKSRSQQKLDAIHDRVVDQLIG